MIPIQNYQKSNTYSQTVIEFNSSFQGAEKFFDIPLIEKI
jgi:hypothetical protein